MNSSQIIEKIRSEKGINNKIKLLKLNKDNKELSLLLAMTYDKVKYNYGITLNYIIDSYHIQKPISPKLSLLDGLKALEKLVDRTYTGNEAKSYLTSILMNLNNKDEDLLRKVINRDLRIDLGRSNINKAIPNLITKQLYAGCNTYRVGTILNKTDKKLNLLLNQIFSEKSYIHVKGHRVTFSETSIGKVLESKLEKIVKYYPDGTYNKSSLKDTSIKKGTSHNIDFPLDKKERPKSVVNLKSDGSYREFSYFNYKLEAHSRSGISYNYPLLSSYFRKLNDSFNGYFISELTVKMSDKLINLLLPKLIELDKKNGTNLEIEYLLDWNTHKISNKEMILPRSLGNGLLNSLEDKISKGLDKDFINLVENHIVVDIWDYVTEEDYRLAALKDKKNEPKIEYRDRFNSVKEAVKLINVPNIRVIEHREVRTLEEATKFASEKMFEGFEGAIIKNYNMKFKDGKSNFQLKLKMKMETEMRVTGFTEGKKGTNRVNTFGSMTFINDEGTIKGSVSGFTDSDLEYFNSNREDTIGKIISIEFNDITKGRNNDYYALSHPRFIEIRNDKNTTDSLVQVLEIKESAKNFS